MLVTPRAPKILTIETCSGEASQPRSGCPGHNRAQKTRIEDGGGEGRANFADILDQPTSCAQRGELRSSRMDLLLQQTILSQLTYVNLTHGLHAPDTSFLRLDVVIDCTEVLQRYVASNPRERRSRLNISARPSKVPASMNSASLTVSRSAFARIQLADPLLVLT